jgi:hypothetical protein
VSGFRLAVVAVTCEAMLRAAGYAALKNEPGGVALAEFVLCEPELDGTCTTT